MVSPFAASDDHDDSVGSDDHDVTDAAAGIAPDASPEGPTATAHVESPVAAAWLDAKLDDAALTDDDGTEDDDAAASDDDDVVPARAVPTHLRALPSRSEAESPTAASQIPRLRDMVRHEGRNLEEAARELGIDPIVASMWLRLPENLWGTGPLAPLPPPAPIATPPIGGIMRVLSCRVPAPAFERLRLGEGSVIERAQAALAAGLEALDNGMTLPLPAAKWRGFTRPLALTVDGPEYLRLRDIATQSFEEDMRDAAGWLIARGVGVSVTNVAPVRPVAAIAPPAATPTRPTARPAAVSSTSTPASRTATTAAAAATTATSDDATGETPPAAPRPVRKERVIEAIRARSIPRAALPPDDSAPDGDELRRRREAVGISQRDLAAASGLSRGLVAEVERGRRRHVMTRARIAETLASVAAEKGISLDTDASVAV